LLHYNKIADLPFFPFCSERCKMVDLGAWLDEAHRIHGDGAFSDGNGDEPE
jgi:hypothetical protein